MIRQEYWYTPSEPHGEGDIAEELWKKLELGESKPPAGKSTVFPIWKSQKSCNKLPLEPKSGGCVWNEKDGVVNIGSRSCLNIGTAA